MQLPCSTNRNNIEWEYLEKDAPYHSMLLTPLAISVQRAIAATCPAVLYYILPIQTAAGTTVIRMCHHSVRFDKLIKTVKTKQRSDVNLLVAS
jgi:hypothetical protein